MLHSWIWSHRHRTWWIETNSEVKGGLALQQHSEEISQSVLQYRHKGLQEGRTQQRSTDSHNLTQLTPDITECAGSILFYPYCSYFYFLTFQRIQKASYAIFGYLFCHRAVAPLEEANEISKPTSTKWILWFTCVALACLSHMDRLDLRF